MVDESTGADAAEDAAAEPAPLITSRFLFVDVAAQRAKQLRRGALEYCVLALVRQWSGSVFPGMVVHSLYNAIVLLGIGSLDERTLERTLLHPACAAASGAVLCAALLSLRPRTTR